jgi:hypothetical protein
MSSKSKRHRRNQKASPDLFDSDLVEQRALRISQDEGHDYVTEEDRQRAKEELFALNGMPQEFKSSTEMEPEIIAWDRAPASFGKRSVKIEPEAEASIDKEQVKNGIRVPRHTGRGNNSP